MQLSSTNEIKNIKISRIDWTGIFWKMLKKGTRLIFILTRL